MLFLLPIENTKTELKHWLLVLALFSVFLSLSLDRDPEGYAERNRTSR